MHILLFAKSIRNSAGIERMTVSLANGLYRLGFRVIILVCGTDNGSFYSVDEGVVVYVLGCPFENRFRAAKSFREILKKLAPDILVNVAVPMGQVSLLGMIGMRKRPRVVAWEHFHLYAGSRFGYMFRLLSAVCCDNTVVLTDRDKRAYPKFLQGKLRRIYNFTALESGALLDSRKQIVLAVGRLEPQKGFDRLLPVWKEVANRVEGWKLRIVGNGWMRQELEAQAETLGIADRVEFLPATPRVAEYYKEAPVYVMSSRYEGLPMVLIEAKQCGMACVSYDCPNGPDEIIRDGQDGYVVSDGDSSALADRLVRLLNDVALQVRFSQAAIEDTCSRFSQDTIMEQWNKLLREIL